MLGPILSSLYILTHLIQQSCDVDEKTNSEKLDNAEIEARQRNWNLNLGSLHLVSLLLTAMLYQSHHAILEKHCKVGIILSFQKLFL